MFGLGPMEIGVIIVVIFIVFGPSLVKRLGKVLTEFRKVGRDSEE